MRTPAPLRVLGISAAVLLAVVVGVGVIQGGLAYVRTSGTSMEPAFTAGDIVVVRGAPDYRVGDVVAYRSDLLDTVVLHRVVARHGDRLVTKGDNNDWLDTERPRTEDVIGRAWIHLPVGARLPQTWPAVAATAAATVVVGLAATQSNRRRRGRSMTDNDRGGAPGRLLPERILRPVAGTATIVLLLAAAASAVAFARPAHSASTVPVTVTQRGAFTYSAPAPTGAAYADGRVTTGEPVFLDLVSAIDVEFRHHFETDAVSDVDTEASIHAEVADVNGWRHRIDLDPRSSSDGTPGEVRAKLDMTEVRAVIEEVATTTGIRTAQYSVDVVATVRIRGTIAGQAVDSTFEPRLEFQLDSRQLRPVPNAGEDPASVLTPEKSTVVEVPSRTHTELSVVGVEATVQAVRRGGLIVGIASLLIAAFSLLVLRRRKGDETTAILGRYGERILPTAASTSEGANAVVDMRSMADLAQLAHHYDGLILHHHGVSEDHFRLQLDRTTYRYVARRADRPAEDPDHPRTKAC